MVEVLNAVFEADFLGFSYGFRPGRCQHDALDALAVGIMHTKVNYIVDADVEKFFDRTAAARGGAVKRPKQRGPTAMSTVGVLAQKGVGYDPAALAAAARQLGLRLEVSDQLRAFDEVEAAFAAMKLKRIDAYFMLGGAVLFSLRQQIMELALVHRLPGIHFARDWAAAGGLLSYGTNLPELYRRAAVYIGKILKGARPAELAVEQPARFDLVINLKTARALGLTIPQSLLLRADDVIQ